MIAAFLSLAVFAFGEQKAHTVQKGETLFSISRQYGISVNELRQLNGLSDTSILKVGQVLKVSAADDTAEPVKAVTSSSSTLTSASSSAYEEYEVQAGDTFYSIARANNITVDELKKINDFDATVVLKYGIVIKVPASEKTASTETEEAEEVLLSVKEDPRKYDSNKKGNINLVWPVKAEDVTYVSGKISGVSITSGKNEPVVAIKEGTVTYSGFYRGFGNVVFVKSSSGYIYVYCGLDTVSVSLGTALKSGDKIGSVGYDSLSQKYQISLMVYKNGKVIDPAVAPRG